LRDALSKGQMVFYSIFKRLKWPQFGPTFPDYHT
jgi:hypothetical protein